MDNLNVYDKNVEVNKDISKNEESSNSEGNELCVFCSEPLSTKRTVRLGKKGSKTINQLNLSLHKNIKVNIGDKVHEYCRLKHYKDGKDLEATHDSKPDCAGENKEVEACAGESMNLKAGENICFFCGKPANLLDKSKRGIAVYPVTSEQFQDTIEKITDQRNDEWAKEVKQRIGTLKLHLSGAIYHQKCNLKYRREIPANSSMGRPKDKNREMAFMKVVDFMSEHESEAFTINELANVMKNECSSDITEYSSQFLKAKLIEYFGDNICFVQNKGKPDYILFRDSANTIISEFYNKKKSADAAAEKKKIIEIASQFISSDIQSIVYNKNEYPTAEQVSSIEFHQAFLPDSLQTLLSGIIKVKKSDLKIASIGQAIIQAANPRRIIAPIQITLAIHLHHYIGSKYIVKLLYLLGLCASYDEVQRFLLCAAASRADDLNQYKPLSPNQAIKFVGDNVDHDSRTIDGENTFHGMGMISALTPSELKSRAIKRTKPSIEDIRAIRSVEIHQYLGESTEKELLYGDISSNSFIGVLIMKKVDLLFNVTWSVETLRPSWSGVMQTINRGDHPGKSSINILPMIDLSASDWNCVYSTLIFLTREAQKYQVVPIIIFDQPLWWKAQIIIQNESIGSPLKQIVLLLGGFHTQMSFLGCIGNLFEGLGLQEAFETIYATNSVPHILSGKAYSRAIRGHFLIHLALNTLFMKELIPQKMTKSEWDQAMDKAKILYDDLIAGKKTITEIESSELLQSLQEEIDAYKETISNKSRTAKLWLQYLEIVDILKCSIRSERTGNWSMHLASSRKKLPYFAAAGHNHYTKCLHIYLQQMLELEKNHPDVYAHFTAGNFVIRRSDRYWAGLSCDLIIEQVLMRSVKSQGGLTRGRGIGENQRFIWIHSMPECVEIKNAIQQLTGLYYETSEQHKDVGASRQQRDLQDMRVLFDFFEERNPFTSNGGYALRNLYNGVEANNDVNVDEANRIGEIILSSMKGQHVSNYTFKKINRTITMHSKNTITIDREVTSIDPQLLFQRLLVFVGKMTDDQLINVFKYELSQRPSSLFDERGLMRSGDGTSLVKALPKEASSNIEKYCPISCSRILGGDFLISQVPWKKNQTYNDICNEYMAYVKKYQDLVIVFEDGSSEPSINDEFNFRQSKGVCCINVAFTEKMPFNSKKETFLSNVYNKQRFIDMLAGKLILSGYTVIRTGTEDINVMITKKTVQLAITRDTVVISNDVNLLFVLCKHYKTSCHKIIFQHFAKGRKQYEWDIGQIYLSLGEETINFLPFVRAIGGCHTTSELYGISNAAPLKKIINDKEFQTIAKVFINPLSTFAEITKAGDEALVILYNGKKKEKLNFLRYKRFHDKLSTASTCIKVQTLPPTEGAAFYHHLRVYLQTQIWIGNNTLNPLEYGWKKDGQKLVPKTTDMEVAPMELLSNIKCGCLGDCSTKRCNCKKNQLKCSVACSECRGSYCLNPSNKIEDDDDDEEQ